MRIVSLIASATEIVCALGLEDQLVGISHECDFPASILRLPRCTETKFKTEGSSAEIDARVKELVRQGLSVYRVFEDRLRELKPDVLVTQIQCEVCAVSEKDVRDALCSWLDYSPRIVSLNPGGLEDIWKDVGLVADAARARVQGEYLIAGLKERIDRIAERARGVAKRPTVACIEWIEPLMSAGNWVPELVELAGGQNLFGIAGKHSPYLDWNEVIATDPEFIFVLPCGWGIERTRQDMRYLTRRPEWSSLRAVREGRVFLADGNQYFNRPGPRVVESLEILAETLHPSLFRFGHQGRGWQTL
jgi:iron complex transport system substrate-binding protein